jgi:integrase
MNKYRNQNPIFTSPLADLFGEFVSEKKACGYRYQSEQSILIRFDRFLVKQQVKRGGLPRSVVEEWTAKRMHESPRTHRIRFNLTRQFALFAKSRGCKAHIPLYRPGPSYRDKLDPYIFTRDEIRRLFTAADNLKYHHGSPLRHLVIPELIRLIYGCGLRVGEARGLRIRDVNLYMGILTVRESKFHKDRLVPMAPGLTSRLKGLNKVLGNRREEAFFFPAPGDKPYCSSAIYENFRHLLRESGIRHRGRGGGPRLHDIRHTFAVHRMVKWYEEGADLNAKLPVLATYMGHKSLFSSQQYLHLTMDLFTDISSGLDRVYGYVIPGRNIQ